MKNTDKKILIAMIVILSIANASYAGSTFTIPVSCSIPAVPGLNTPIVENKALAAQLAQKNTRITEPTVPKEEVKYVMQQDKKDGSSITVTSVYIR